jgi:regulator of sirC expression with transglutaminase-like and TPR domain
VNHSEVNALIALLEDDDPAIRGIVMARLESDRDSAIEPLRIAANSENAKVRARARALCEQFDSEILSKELLQRLGSDAFDLEEALILLARVENPLLTPQAVRAELDRIAARLLEESAACRNPQSRAMTMGRYLSTVEGFQGNAEQYYDPRNTYIDAVLLRRLGIPISLSVIYILVGRRAGFQMWGVGMPCHFLVQATIRGEKFLLDPFGEGRILTSEACRVLLAGFRHSFREDYLRPVSDRDLVRRMIANLIRIYHERGDTKRLERFYGFVNAIQSHS